MVAGGLLWFGTTSTDPLVGIGATVSTMIMFVGMVHARAVRHPAAGAADGASAAPPDAGRGTARGRRGAGQPGAHRGDRRHAARRPVGGRRQRHRRLQLRRLGRTRDRQGVRRAISPSSRSATRKRGRPSPGISARLRNQIAALPETGAVASRRSLYVQHLPGGGSKGVIVGYDPYQYRRVDKVDYIGAPLQSVLRGLAAGGVVPVQGLRQRPRPARGRSAAPRRPGRRS